MYLGTGLQIRFERITKEVRRVIRELCENRDSCPKQESYRTTRGFDHLRVTTSLWLRLFQIRPFLKPVEAVQIRFIFV
jgi:hypothetical protein